MGPTGRSWTGGLRRCISESLRTAARTIVGVSSPSAKWASSGLACLTGSPDGPPDFSRAGVLGLRSLVYAAGEPDRAVLDWRFSALHF